jgi:Domain of unknown function (DUF6431)
LLTVGPDPIVAEQMLADGLLRCPDCAGVLARWGHVARRFVRDAIGMVERIRLRRTICPLGDEGGCGRTHVLLPAFLLGRRLDVVEVIWSALRVCVDGLGWRRLAARVSRPASTVRGWVARARGRAGMVRDRFTQLEHLLVAADGDDMARVAPTGSGLGDAVAQIGVCLAALRRARPAALEAMSVARTVAVLSGGWLLGTRPLRCLLPGFPT